jgi:hypothetical protein
MSQVDFIHHEKQVEDHEIMNKNAFDPGNNLDRNHEDVEDLTEEQRNFAEVLGRLLAEKWRRETSSGRPLVQPLIGDPRDNRRTDCSG